MTSLLCEGAVKAWFKDADGVLVVVSLDVDQNDEATPCFDWQRDVLMWDEFIPPALTVSGRMALCLLMDRMTCLVRLDP